MIIGTANLHHGVDPAGALRIGEIASALAALEWDVLAVQELDRFVGRSSASDQPRILMEACRAEGRFTRTVRLAGGEYGIAVLWRPPPAGIASGALLPSVNGGEPRAAVKVRLENGAAVTATHLDPVREAATTALGRLIASAGPKEVIAGDLNLDARDLDLPAPWAIAGDGQGHATFPAQGPSSWIDHVLYRTDGWRLLRSWTARLPATDHLAFFAELEELPAPAPP